MRAHVSPTKAKPCCADGCGEVLIAPCFIFSASSGMIYCLGIARSHVLKGFSTPRPNMLSVLYVARCLRGSRSSSPLRYNAKRRHWRRTKIGL